MSVIVARALPDARDGLKPVHRRILYAMYDMGLRPEFGLQKIARIVGEVLGKYHPHGDHGGLRSHGAHGAGFLDALPAGGWAGQLRQRGWRSARGHALHRSAPGSAGYGTAGRYRKEHGRLRRDNFDGTLEEPTVLPAAIPNLLVNGATGIAVGMATSIPPHNLGEVVDALRYMLENWEKLDDIGVEDLMHFIQGPDFPTGGVILPGGSRRGYPGERLRHRARAGHRAGPGPPGRDGARPQPHHRHRAALHDQQSLPDRAHRRAGARRAGWRASPTCATNPTARGCAS